MGEESDALEIEAWGHVAEMDFDDAEEFGWEAIKKIESYTQSDVKFELMLIGINQNSGNWDDYEKAKKRIFGAWYINPEIYQQQIKWIADYLQL